MREELSLDGQQFYFIFSFSWLSGFRYWDFKLINNHISFLVQVQSQLITRCCYQREAYIFESALLQIRLNYKMQFGLWPPDIPLSKLLSSSRFGQLQASLTVARQNGTCTSQEQSSPQTRGALKEPKWACLVPSPKSLSQVKLHLPPQGGVSEATTKRGQEGYSIEINPLMETWVLTSRGSLLAQGWGKIIAFLFFQMSSHVNNPIFSI